MPCYSSNTCLKPSLVAAVTLGSFVEVFPSASALLMAAATATAAAYPWAWIEFMERRSLLILSQIFLWSELQ